MNRKGFSTIMLIGTIVIIVLVVGITGYFIIAPQLERLRKTSTSEEKTSLTEVQPSEKPIQESIQDILAKGENIGPVQYEMVTITSATVLGKSESIIGTTNVWLKIPYMKMESIISGVPGKGVEIMRPDGTYIYDASKDKYLNVTSKTKETAEKNLSFAEFIKEIKENKTLKELGTEIINEKLTTIIEYSVGELVVEKNLLTQTMKLWIWNEKGIPLKGELTTKAGNNIISTTKMEFKNFVFADIPDSLFEVPKDKIIKITP